MASGGKKSKKDRNKKDDIKNYWQRKAAPMAVRDYQWRIYLYRGNVGSKKQRLVRIDPLVTSMTWEDAVIQEASISLTNPRLREGPFHIVEGHKVIVHYSGNRDGGNWRKLFTLRITSVSTTPGSDTIDIEAVDELGWLKRSKDDFAYRKGKGKSREKRENGWRCHQIARDVAKRYGIKVGSLAKGNAEIKELVKKKADPLSVIEAAYKKEREESGYRYVIRMRNGKLYVTRLIRSRELLVYGGQALDAQITRRITDKVATQLTVRGKVSEDGTEKKKTVRVKASKKIRRRYGTIHDYWNLDEPVNSLQALRRKARREMVERQEPKWEASITVPGFPGLQRGDSIRVALKDAGLVDLVYVTAASHNVTSGQYTTDLTLTFDEFYKDEKGAKIREKKCEEARKNKRKLPKTCRKNYDPFAPNMKKRKSKARNKGDNRPARKSRRRPVRN